MAKANGRAIRERGFWFTSLRLENWKNFLSVEEGLRERVFLVGPNAAGKSNLLDAFRFLRDVVAVGGGFQEAVRRRGGVGAIRCLAASGRPEVVLNVTIGDDESPREWEYLLAFSQNSNQRPVIKQERVLRAGEAILERPLAEDAEDEERLTQTCLEQVNVNRGFRDVAEFFAAVCYLHIVPQLVREPDRSAAKTDDPFGGGFLEQIASTPTRTRQARLKRIQEALRVAIPQLSEIELWKDDRGTPHLRGKYEHWRAPGAWQSEDQFSDGTLRLIGLLWSVLDGWGPLLLEEPEMSLHPAIVRVLPQMFARLQRRSGRQILLSTHSPDILRDEGIGLDEVFVLLPEKKGSRVRSVSEFEEIPALLEGGLSLADAVLPRTRPSDAMPLSLFGDR